jgi:hypothetical protein
MRHREAVVQPTDAREFLIGSPIPQHAHNLHLVLRLSAVFGRRFRDLESKSLHLSGLRYHLNLENLSKLPLSQRFNHVIIAPSVVCENVSNANYKLPVAIIVAPILLTGN